MTHIRPRTACVAVALVATAAACSVIRPKQSARAVDPPPDAAARGEAPREAAPAREPRPGPVALLVWTPVDTGCAWQVWTPEAGATALWVTPDCPVSMSFSADGRRIVYATDHNAVVEQPWAPGGASAVLPMPAGLGGRWEATWFGADGVARCAVIAPAEQSVRGQEIVLTAGPARATVQVSGEGAAYGVAGTAVVAPGQGDRVVELHEAVAQIAVFFERRGAGWAQVAALPTMKTQFDEITLGPGLGVGDALLARDTGLRLNPANTFFATDAEAPEAWGRDPQLRQAIGVVDDEDTFTVGFTAVGAGGVLYRIGWGDTPHPMGPGLWCADRTCATRAPLEGAPQGQLTIDPRGDFVLVGVERTGADARIYRDGPWPIAAFPGAQGAMWVPVGGIPPFGGP